MSITREETDRKIALYSIGTAKMDFAALPRPFKAFVDWASGSTFGPDEFILVGFLGAIAALMKNSIILDHPTGKIKPHLWIACIAPSSKGKTSALNVAARFLSEIDAPLEEKNRKALKQYQIEKKRFDKEVLKTNSEVTAEEEPQRPKCKSFLKPTITSLQRLMEQLALDDPTGIIYVPSELSIILSDWKQDRNEGVAHFFMSLFDSPPILPMSSYKNAPELPPIKNPSVSIIGATTITSFFQRMSAEDLVSGNLQRWLIATTQSQKIKQAWPERRSEEGKKRFWCFFNELNRLSDQSDKQLFNLSEEALAYWKQIYPDLNKSFYTAQLEDHILSSLDRVNDTYILKFALIIDVSKQVNEKLDDQDYAYHRSISKGSLIEAITLSDYFKQSLIDVIQESQNLSTKLMMSKIVHRLRRSHGSVMTYPTLKEYVNAYKRNESSYDIALELLEEWGIISIDIGENNSNNGVPSKFITLLEGFTTVLLPFQENDNV